MRPHYEYQNIHGQMVGNIVMIHSLANFQLRDTALLKSVEQPIQFILYNFIVMNIFINFQCSFVRFLLFSIMVLVTPQYCLESNASKYVIQYLKIT